LFVKRGADINVILKSGEPFVNEALSNIRRFLSNTEIVRFVCEIADLTKAGLSGDYCLHCALNRTKWKTVTGGEANSSLIKTILSHGADQNQLNLAGKSLLTSPLSNRDRHYSLEAFSDTKMAEKQLMDGLTRFARICRELFRSIPPLGTTQVEKR
jgi:hypothetical protein